MAALCGRQQHHFISTWKLCSINSQISTRSRKHHGRIVFRRSGGSWSRVGYSSHLLQNCSSNLSNDSGAKSVGRYARARSEFWRGYIHSFIHSSIHSFTHSISFRNNLYLTHILSFFVFFSLFILSLFFVLLLFLFFCFFSHLIYINRLKFV